MHVVTFDKAPAYSAAGHVDMAMRRLQGLEAGPSDSVWIGCSELAPGAGTTSSASSVEKFYICLEGEVHVTASQHGRSETVLLRSLDSCRIAAGESRQLSNSSQLPARLLLVMPHRT